MLITMNRSEFESMSDISLIWDCIEPTIRQVRGKNFKVKSEAYSQLTKGQRALLMFQMLYGHTSNGVEEFYSHQSYLLANKGVWMQLKEGMKYFGAIDMLQILEEMDSVYQRINTDEFKENVEQYNVLMTPINQSVELFETISQINKKLNNIIPLTIKLVSTYIRNNTNEFVELID